MNLAFLIGCKKYDDPDVGDLRYADIDAHSFAQTIASNCGFSDNEIRLLSSCQEHRHFHPTKSNIIRELSKGITLIGNSRIELIFFFFSGHGFHSKHDGRDYLVPQDAVISALEDTSIPFDSVLKYLKNCRAKNVVLFLDACRATVQGGKDIVIETLNKIDVKALFAEGMASFASCSPREKSYEADELQSGIFTYCLRQALSDVGKCKTIYELDSYLANSIPRACNLSHKPIQNPYTRVEPLSIKDVILVSDQKLNEWNLQTPIGKEIRASYPYTVTNIPLRRESFTCGIDFGTSFSTIGFLDDDKKIRLIPSPEKRTLVPSVISFLSNWDYLVGWEALENANHSPESTIFNIKRYLGSKRVFNIRGKSLSPEFVTSLIIRSLRANAEEYLSTRIETILVSAPANFGIAQSNALVRACELADLKVKRLLGEPCAAAILLDQIMISSPELENVAVLDLGGGTFDVSIMEIGEGVIETKVVAGDNNLGGVDYNIALYDYIVSVIKSAITDADYELSEVDKSQIRFEAERAKIALGLSETTSVILQNIEVDELGLRNFEVAVNRELFRKLMAELDLRVENCIRHAIELSGVKVENIQMVLLSGQGSKIFTVKDIIERLFESVPIVTKYQESAVAQGLCKYSGVFDGLEKNLLLLDTSYTAIAIKCISVFNHELYERDKGNQKNFVIAGDEIDNTSTFDLIPPGSRVPAFKWWTAEIRKADSNRVKLSIVERSNFGDVEHSPVGIIEVDLQERVDKLEIAVDCDVERTIILFIKNPLAEEILGFQVNNLFRTAVFNRKDMATLLAKMGPDISSQMDKEMRRLRRTVFEEWNREGYELGPIKRLNSV